MRAPSPLSGDPLRVLATLVGVLVPIPIHQVLAQSSLVAPQVTVVSPSYDRWWFSGRVSSDAFLLSGLDQTTIPVSLSLTPIRNWRLELSASYSWGRVRAVELESGTERVFALDGPTDARVRAVGKLLDERVWLTLGAKLPIGRTGLSREEAFAARVLGAPVLGMRSPVLGSGTGFTAGVVYAALVGSWAVAAGASLEARSTYTPLDLALVDGRSVEVDLDPGEVLHLTLGLDRIAGAGRLSVVLAADVYGRDLITIRPADGSPAARSRYRMGPTGAVSAAYRTRGLGASELSLSLEGRYRDEFTDAQGRRAGGSSGTVVEADASATFGPPRGPALTVGLGALADSGLEIDRSVATAAMTSGSVTVGLVAPAAGLRLEPYVRGRIGRLDAGGGGLTAGGLSAGLRATFR